MEVFETIFEYSFNTYKKKNQAQELTQIYLNKFPESGEAINNVAKIITADDIPVNSLINLVEEYSKKWLLNYNFHNNEEEIGSVIEALSIVGSLDKLFIDFTFWKKMEKCNAFVSIIDTVSFVTGFDTCFNLIEKNFFAAKAYGENGLMDKWIQASNQIATRYEDAQEAYIFFVSHLLDEESVLDSRSREILTKKIIYNILQQASENRKQYELMANKEKNLQSEYTQNVIFRIYKPLEKLEKTVTMYSDISDGIENDSIVVIRNLVGKLRQALAQVGINPVAEIEDWEKRKVIPFDGKMHLCAEEVKNGQNVSYLSMGMKDTKDEFFEKASVVIHMGEINDGNNI